MRAQLDPKAFFKGKRLEQDERYVRHQETPYALEPNCKESPGGLRDLQVILWISRAAGLGESWNDLARRGYITRGEALQLKGLETFLRHARIRLHYLTGRREDRLLFDHQEAIANRFGIAAGRTRRASELLMQRLLQDGEIRHPAQHHSSAEPRRGDLSRAEQGADRHQCPFSDGSRTAGCAQRGRLREDPLRPSLKAS
jgi:UTP:GlnB (protein PII) uridylyltransferase